MNQVGGKPCAYGNFVKFKNRGAFHHNKEMPTCDFFVAVNVSLLTTTSLPFLDLDHDTPLKTIGDAIGYIILWPWKLTSSKM
jgi:hypothetical protein